MSSIFSRYKKALEENDQNDAEDLENQPKNELDDVINEGVTSEVKEEINEIEADQEAIEEANELLDESIDKVEDINEKLENPDSVTDEDVQQASESFNKVLIKLGDYNIYSESTGQLHAALESYTSSSFERLNACREGFVDFIKRIIEMIKNIYRKTVTWFKKIYARLLIMISNYTKKVKTIQTALSKKKTQNVVLSASDTKELFRNMPLVGYICSKEKSISPLGEVAVRIHSTKNVSRVLGILSKTLRDAMDKLTENNDENTNNNIYNAAISETIKALDNAGAHGLKLASVLGLSNNEFVEPITYVGKSIKCFYMNSEDESGIPITIKTIEVPDSALDDNSVEIKYGKNDLSKILAELEKAAKDGTKFYKEVMKLPEQGGGIIKVLENKARAEVSDTNNYDLRVTKIANISRNLSMNFSISLVMNYIKSLGALTALTGNLTRSLDVLGNE